MDNDQGREGFIPELQPLKIFNHSLANSITFMTKSSLYVQLFPVDFITSQSPL